MNEQYDLTPLAWVMLGAGVMLLLVQTGLLVFVWANIGAHVSKTITEAGKRAVDERLGRKKKQ